MNLKTSLWAVALLVFGAALLFTLSAPTASAGTTLYVDANVAASGSGTEASPLKTITAAVAAASNGDKIYLKNGTYAASTNGETYPITVGKQLSFEGQSQDGVILDAESNPVATYIFLATEAANVTKMKLTGFTSTAIYLTKADSSVTYCTFEGYFGGYRKGAWGIISTASGNFSYNIFHDFRYAGIYLLNSSGGIETTVSYNEFTNEHAASGMTSNYGVYQACIGDTDSKTYITNNTFQGTEQNNYLYSAYYSALTTNTTRKIVFEDNAVRHAVYGVLLLSVLGTNNFQISNNVFQDGNPSHIAAIYLAELYDTTTTAQIYNNVISGTKYGILLYPDPAGYASHPADYLVTNNTIDKASTAAIYGRSSAGNNAKLVTQNNVITNSEVGLKNGVTATSAIKNFSSDYNVFSEISKDTYLEVAPGEHDQTIDPQYTDADNGDYTVLGSSPLIDAGTESLAPTDDINMTARPQGRGFDIGAYESMDWSGTFREGNGYITTAPASQGGPQYKFFKYDGAQVYKAINAFNTDWRSEFKVQTADVNSDGADEIVAYAGAGVEPKIRIYKKNGDRLAEATAFSAGFRGGLNAVTGDFNNDGKIEIAVAPAASGGPTVQVFKYANGKLSLMTQFTAYSGSMRGGFNLAAGDTDAQGFKSIIVAPAASTAGPEVRVFRYENGKFVQKAAILAYGSGNRDGVNLTAADLNRDGKDEVVTAPMNGKSNVRVYREENKKLVLLDWELVLGNSFAGGVNLNSGDVNGDQKGEIVITPAHSGGPNLMIYELNDDNQLAKVTSKIVYAASLRAGYKTAVGDLNDDGIDEIAIVPTSPQTSNIQVFTWADNKLSKVKSFLAYAGDFRGGINLAIGGR